MSSLPSAELRIEVAREADLGSIVEIDGETLGSKAADQVYAREIRLDISRIDVVAEVSLSGAREVVAFINYWDVADEIHLLSVATRPDRQRCGHGRLLMTHLLAYARRQGARCITLEVRESNLAAKALYQSLGFEIASVRRRYYAETREDALVMLLGVGAAVSI